MKNLKLFIASLIVIFTVDACAQKVVFPTSTVAPAAVASVKFKKDKNQNYQIHFTAKYLATPQKLTPSKNYYVVWIETEDSEVINVGSLTSSAKRGAFLKFVTSFKPVRIIVTAEDTPDVKYPGSMEILKSEIFKLN